ncbi:hypothetical protein REPUB_Repub16aG0040800 [Reevesia pubescens]
MLYTLDPSSVSCKSLFGILRVVLSLNISKSSKKKLESMIGSQMDKATLDNMLILSPCGTSYLYGVNLVLRFLKAFKRGGGWQLYPIQMKKVASLVDLYMAEVAPDPCLKSSKFQALLVALPNSTRDSWDELYHTMDIYQEVVSRLKKRKSSKITSRRKKSDKMLVLQSYTETGDGPLIEKSVVCSHWHSLTGIDAFYLFNFEDKVDQQKEKKIILHRILHGPYELGRSPLPPVLGPQIMPFESKSTGKFTALGSNIYHIGGYDSCFSKKVYRFDTCNPYRGWAEFAPLIRGGHFASVAVLDNKIYVMHIFFWKR